jgi:hypothetical protein
MRKCDAFAPEVSEGAPFHVLALRWNGQAWRQPPLQECHGITARK